MNKAECARYSALYPNGYIARKTFGVAMDPIEMIVLGPPRRADRGKHIVVDAKRVGCQTVEPVMPQRLTYVRGMDDDA